MDYIAVHIKIEPFSDERAEIVEAGISDLGFDSFTIEEPCLNAFIPKEQLSLPDLKTMLSAFGNADFGLSYTTELIPEQNWNAVWESDFEPVVVAGEVTVKAPWHDDLPRTRYNITIVPEMSFGSGHHQTTCMMVEGLLAEGSWLKGRSVLDMGCGTGILAIAAAKLGAGVPVHAVDIDPVCVRSAYSNARRNRVGKKLVTVRGDASVIQKGQYDLVLANIHRNILLADMSTYMRGLKPSGGKIFLSGFYTADIPVLVEKAESLGLRHTFTRSRDDWAMIVLEKAAE